MSQHEEGADELVNMDQLEGSACLPLLLNKFENQPHSPPLMLGEGDDMDQLEGSARLHSNPRHGGDRGGGDTLGKKTWTSSIGSLFLFLFIMTLPCSFCMVIVLVNFLELEY